MQASTLFVYCLNSCEWSARPWAFWDCQCGCMSVLILISLCKTVFLFCSEHQLHDILFRIICFLMNRNTFYVCFLFCICHKTNWPAGNSIMSGNNHGWPAGCTVDCSLRIGADWEEFSAVRYVTSSEFLPFLGGFRVRLPSFAYIEMHFHIFE